MEEERIIKERVAFKGAPGESSPVSHSEAQDILKAQEAARARLGKCNDPSQMIGQSTSIGCVALEITQRCNLDCTLCYLSDNSEDVLDIPMQEVLRRLDEIKSQYGVGTVVQVTGGDPTLRKASELTEIVRYARNIGLSPALFTNGIRATREMLTELSEAGLCDVAFHVDITQERDGYNSETELNEIRKNYVERARGLNLSVIFNTTICEQNFHEIPALIKFYRENAEVINFVSFQLQADTGRGELTKRDVVVSVDTVREAIEKGTETSLLWDPVMIGHPKCHSFAYAFAVNGNLYSMVNEGDPVVEGMDAFKYVMFDRRQSIWGNLKPVLPVLKKKPSLIPLFARYAIPKLWKMKKDLIKSGGRINRLSFFIHNFMDADSLDQERVDACSFMVMTHKGPVSMCAHNAKRDEYILEPFEIETPDGKEIWDPMRERPMKNRKARGERHWKSLKVVNENEKAPTNGKCGGCR